MDKILLLFMLINLSHSYNISDFYDKSINNANKLYNISLSYVIMFYILSLFIIAIISCIIYYVFCSRKKDKFTVSINQSA